MEHAACEDLLEAVLVLTRKGDPPVAGDLAAYLHRDEPAVSAHLAELAAAGKLAIGPGGAVTLLPPGQAIAARVADRHRILECFLAERLGMERKAASGEACHLEHQVSEETIRAYIDVGEEAGLIRGEEGEMFESLFEFGETIVREVMTPRIDMVCIEADRDLAALRDQINESKHSRLPVFRERVDNVVGVVTIKDLIDAWSAGRLDKTVAAIMRPVHFVPETTRVTMLLRDCRAGGVPASWRNLTRISPGTNAVGCAGSAASVTVAAAGVPCSTAGAPSPSVLISTKSLPIPSASKTVRSSSGSRRSSRRNRARPEAPDRRSVGRQARPRRAPGRTALVPFR